MYQDYNKKKADYLKELDKKYNDQLTEYDKSLQEEKKKETDAFGEENSKRILELEKRYKENKEQWVLSIFSEVTG